MEKIVYVYGSARDAATRALRRAALPRSMQVRIGQWVIRPARRTAVQTAELAKYETDVIDKVTRGLIQVQRGDTSPYSIEEIRKGFAALKGTSEAPSFLTMPFGELMEAMRAESPSQEAWDAFVQRCLNEEDADKEFLPDMGTRLRSLTEFAERNSARLDVTASFALIDAARGAWEEAQRQKSEPAQQTEPTPPAPQLGDMPESVVNRLADMEQADLDPQPEEPEAPSEEPAASSTHEDREAQLPEGWRSFTNAKLVELLTSLEVELPERQNKSSLVSAVEAWLGGS